MGFSFEEFEANWEKMSVSPPTPASLALAKEMGLKLGEAFVTGSEKVADYNPAKMVRELAGYSDPALDVLPVDTLSAFSGAVHDSIDYVNARRHIAQHFGSDILVHLDMVAEIAQEGVTA